MQLGKWISKILSKWSVELSAFLMISFALAEIDLLPWVVIQIFLIIAFIGLFVVVMAKFAVQAFKDVSKSFHEAKKCITQTKTKTTNESEQ